MHSTFGILAMSAIASAFKSGRWDLSCKSDLDCKTWSDIGTTWSDTSNLSKVPHVVNNCCPIRKLDPDGCPLGDTGYDPTIRKCASYCPVKMWYEWGPEVFYLNRGVCHDDDVRCDLPANSQAIFKASPLPGEISSPQAIQQNLFGGFNDGPMMAWSNISATEAFRPVNADGYGAYWTFIPLYKVTCGTYTESSDIVDEAAQCNHFSGPKNVSGNVCISEPVKDPKNKLRAIGISQLIPVTKGDGDWQGEADLQSLSLEYLQKGVAWPYDGGQDSVRSGFARFQERNDHVSQSGTSGKPAAAYTIDGNSPLTTDCLEAASAFYMPLWQDRLEPYTDAWVNGCDNQTQIGWFYGEYNDITRPVSRPCAVIGGNGTCQIQLIFPNGFTNVDVTKDTTVSNYYTSRCYNRDGGGLWRFLSSFQKIFNEATDSSGHTAGQMELWDDGECATVVAFVPSNGAKVTVKS